MQRLKLKTVRKSVISIVMVFALLFGSIANAATFQDVRENHWASKAIAEWAEKRLIKGYEDGSFKPNESITRAEFMTLVNGGFDLTEEQAISFTDVKAGAWYESAVRKAAAAAYLTGYSDNTIKPNHKISRQEVAVALAKLLKLGGNPSAAAMFTDEIPTWSQGAIGAVVARGYMVGYENGSFGANQPITRAEVIVVLDRVIKSQAGSGSETTAADWTIEEAGTYGPASGVQEVAGDVIISAAGVTLQNVTVKGNLTIAESVGEGDVFLNGVTVNGAAYIYGGGENSIHLTDTLLVNVTVNKRLGTVRIVVKGASEIKNITLDSKVLLELGSESKIALATINAISNIVGQGTFAHVQINVSGVTFEYEPNKVATAAGITAPAITKPGSTAGGSGSTGGGSTGGNNGGSNGENGGGSNGGNNGGGSTPDTTKPIVTISSEDEESSILATSNEAGAIYLVLKTASIETATDLDDAAAINGIKAEVSTANSIVKLSKAELLGTYVVYAVDQAGNISNPSSAIYIYPAEYTLIKTAADLSNVRNGLAGKYVQVEDIDLSAYNSSNGGWQPIGYYKFDDEWNDELGEWIDLSENHSFTGQYDGNGHQITGMYVEGLMDDMDRGLFGAIGEGSIIANVQLVDAIVNVEEYDEESFYTAGSLAGLNIGGTIQNSSVTGEVTNAGNYTGGLVGVMLDGTISDSYFEGNVTGSYYVGGLVGEIYNGNIIDSHVEGDITGLETVGGLVGSLQGNEEQHSKIENSSFSGEIVSTTSEYGDEGTGGLAGHLVNGQIIDSSVDAYIDGMDLVGGLVGYISNGEITNSSFTGEVSGEDSIGGLVGGAHVVKITNSTVVGTVTGTGSSVGGLVGSISYSGEITGSNTTANVDGEENIGGLVGSVGHSEVTITNSYATGDVSGEEYIGGLVGENSGIIIASYATGDVSGKDYVGGLIGGNYNEITASYATGNVSGKFNIGGLIGLNYNGIMNNYATGDVTGEECVGGLIGTVLNGGTGIKNNYATGSVKGKNYVGGLIGQSSGADAQYNFALNSRIISDDSSEPSFGRIVGSYANATIRNNYAIDNMIVPEGIDIDTNLESNKDSNIGTPINGTTITSDAAQSAEVYLNLGWSEDVWSFVDGQFPILKWQTN